MHTSYDVINKYHVIINTLYLGKVDEVIPIIRSLSIISFPVNILQLVSNPVRSKWSDRLCSQLKTIEHWKMKLLMLVSNFMKTNLGLSSSESREYSNKFAFAY